MDQPKYHIEIFWSDEDGGYIANVPDLHYCSAFGETYEEALREVLEAMELHLDTLRELDRPIPKPKTHLVSEIDTLGSSYGRGTQVIKDEDVDVTVAIADVDEAAGQTFGTPAELYGQIRAFVGDFSESRPERMAAFRASSEIDLAVLTRRQREVLEMAAQGLNKTQIARELHRSVSTVNHHMRAAAKALSAARTVDKTTLKAIRRRPPQ